MQHMAFAAGVICTSLFFSTEISGQTTQKQYNGKSFSFVYPSTLSIVEDDDTEVSLKVSANQSTRLAFKVHTAPVSSGEWIPWNKRDLTTAPAFDIPFLDAHENTLIQAAKQNGAQVRTERMFMKLGKYSGVAVHVTMETPDQRRIAESTVVEVGPGKYLAGLVIADAWSIEQAFRLRKQIMDTLQLK
jgi:hypothetical protein